MPKKYETPLLDELEKGPFPSFVTEIKKAAAKSDMAADELGQLEKSYRDKRGYWKHGGIVGVSKRQDEIGNRVGRRHEIGDRAEQCRLDPAGRPAVGRAVEGGERLLGERDPAQHALQIGEEALAQAILVVVDPGGEIAGGSGHAGKDRDRNCLSQGRARFARTARQSSIAIMGMRS